MKTILVIDEDDMMRENTAEILKLSNYKVLSVESSRRGLEVAINRHPDLILCDELLPHHEGDALLQQIRKSAELRKVPIVLIAEPNAESVRCLTGIESPDDYLIKPFEGEELLRIVAKYLNPEKGQAICK